MSQRPANKKKNYFSIILKTVSSFITTDTGRNINIPYYMTTKNTYMYIYYMYIVILLGLTYLFISPTAYDIFSFRKPVYSTRVVAERPLLPQLLTIQLIE